MTKGKLPERMVRLNYNKETCKFEGCARLTPESKTDEVGLVYTPNCLPIIFVPGIMGSNLERGGKPVWLLNDVGGFGIPLGELKKAVYANAIRQLYLDPATTRVYKGGNTPDKPVGSILDVAEYKRRGWGQIGQTSYHEFLVYLEETLNGVNVLTPDQVLRSFASPAVHQKIGIPALTPKEKDGLINWSYPVYAKGYNWLKLNADSAQELANEIEKIIKENNTKDGKRRCKQVIIITHSMGGLVTRAMIQKLGYSINSKIAGVIHGVMPTTGSPTAYRRVKVGMRDEDYGAGLVIGTGGDQVTVVFGQAPEALQLLPNQRYAKNWLRILDEKGAVIDTYPKQDPYDEIYLNRRNWWRLINQDWMNPLGGKNYPLSRVEENINQARLFHLSLKSNSYHLNTYVYFWGDITNKNSYEFIDWLPRGASAHPSDRQKMTEVAAMSDNPLLTHNPNHIAINTPPDKLFGSAIQTSAWFLKPGGKNGGGDGTVPISSGVAAKSEGGGKVKVQLQLKTVLSHESSYKQVLSQDFVSYCLAKIAAKAEIPPAKLKYKSMKSYLAKFAIYALSLVTCFACYSSRIEPSEKDMQTINDLTKEMETHCIGRYQIDLPKGFGIKFDNLISESVKDVNLSIKQNTTPRLKLFFSEAETLHYATLSINHTKLSGEQIKTLIQKRIEAIQKVVDYTDDKKRLMSISPIENGYLSKIYNPGRFSYEMLYMGALDSTYFDIGLGPVAIEHPFNKQISKEDLLSNERMFNKNMNAIIQSVRSYKTPSGAGEGFCMGNLIIPDSIGHNDEELELELVHPKRKDLVFKVLIAAKTPNNPDDLFERAKIAFAVNEKFPQMGDTNDKLLLEKKEKFQDMDLLQSGFSSDLDTKDGRMIIFQLETRRNEKDAGFKKPLLNIVMTTNPVNEDGKDLPSILTDGQALLLWEAVVKTLKPRDGAGTGTAGVKTSQLEYCKGSEPCPKTGYWRPNTMDNKNFNAKAVNALLPRYVQQGQTMPALGDKAEYEKNISWMWVGAS